MADRYSDPQLRELLAAAYVLGTLHGRARARFQSLMRYDRALQREVADWQERLQPLADALPERAPPARVWTAIGSRLGHTGPTQVPAAQRAADARTPWWHGLALWRGLAVAMTVSTIALGLRLQYTQSPATTVATATPATQQAGTGMMAILTDASAQPTMLVSWPMQPRADGKVELRVRIIMDHPSMDPNTSWQLWLVPRETGGRPQPIGLIGIEPEQQLTVDGAMLKALIEAAGMALSNEPAGGSPTGVPTGPMIFRGPNIRT